MKRIALTAAALVLAASAASAAEKAKRPKAGELTQNDIRVCMGVDGSSADDQIPACTKIIKSGKVKPEHLGDYYATRGAAHFAKLDLANALADFDKALSIRKAPEFYFQRALVRISQKDYAPAKADIGQVIALKPAFAPSYLMRGIIAYGEGEYAEAVTHFTSAIERNPTYYQALFARGVAKKKAGQDGDKDIADAKSMSPRVDKDLAPFGIAP